MTTQEWQQISGDMTASEYGATFGQLDSNFDGTYDVNVVEIINMLDATGDESSADKRYYVSTSYCDVDDVELSRMRSIMESMGWLSRQENDTPEYPDGVPDRVATLETMLKEYRAMYSWQGTFTPAQELAFVKVQSELETLRAWFSVPRMMRAEAMHSYGGYESDSYRERNYKTLAYAMRSEGIPREALWTPSEYDAIPDGVDAGNGTRLSITLPYSGSVYHREGIDSDGYVWTEYDMRGYLDMYDDGDSTCTGCGERIESHCWHDNNGMMEQYCPECVDYSYGHITLPA